MNFDIERVINALRKQREVFTSEADFQLEMGWKIKELYPEAVVRMEYCPEFDANMHIDIMVFMGGKQIPIELKYKTKKCELISNGESYRLKNHSAKNQTCYRYLKDIQRIETVKKSSDRFEKGYTVFLTNDKSYIGKCSPNCGYHEFSLGDGEEKHGLMQWSSTMSEGTKKGCEDSILLEGVYPISWKLYSRIKDENIGTFYILFNEIK